MEMINTAPVAALSGAVPGSTIRSILPEAARLVLSAAGQEQPPGEAALPKWSWSSAAGREGVAALPAWQGWERGLAGALQLGRSLSHLLVGGLETER